jgi:hypothetical protein
MTLVILKEEAIFSSAIFAINEGGIMNQRIIINSLGCIVYTTIIATCPFQ